MNIKEDKGMKEALRQLSKEHIDFICSECNVSEEQLFSMNNDELYDNVYDVMCDIEIEETPSDDSELSERCQNAEDIVTLLGNTLQINE